jgi:hypothetical protein
MVGAGDLFADIQPWAREAEEEPQTYADWLDMERYAPYHAPLHPSPNPNPAHHLAPVLALHAGIEPDKLLVRA